LHIFAHLYLQTLTHTLHYTTLYTPQSKLADGVTSDAFAAGGLDARDIDAFWIQRQVAVHFTEAHEASKISQEMFLALADESMNDGQCENVLAELTKWSALDVVLKCIKNRRKVVFCTRLARASAEDRDAIEKEMMSDPVLRTILERLHHTDTAADRMKQKERALQMEVQKLRGDADSSNSGSRTDATEAPTWSMKPTQVVDFQALSFDEGDHFMANRCVCV
jgi:pre-mRNA-splicing helicase BRR2